MKRKFTVEVEMEERWVDNFCSMLHYIESLGNMGASDIVGIYADGDGDFRPKFKINTSYEKVEPISGYKNPEKVETVLYDAG